MESSKPGQPVSVVGQNAVVPPPTTAPTPNRATIVVGDEVWPFPVPTDQLRMASGISMPRKGDRKSSTGASARTNWTPLQCVAAMSKRRKSMHQEFTTTWGVIKYAQKIFSSTGQQNGLYRKIPTAHPKDRSETLWPKPWKRDTPAASQDSMATTSRS